MTGLLASEFLRVASRRSTWAVTLLLLVLAAVQPLLLLESVRPLDAADHRAAQETRAAEIRARDEYLAECTDPQCLTVDDWEIGPLSSYLRYVQPFEDFAVWQFETGAQYVGIAFILVWGIVAATSDFRTGVLSTQLTFTPQRLPVMAARVVSVLAAGVSMAVLAVCASVGASTFGYISVSGPEGLTAGTHLLVVAGRLVLGTALFLLATMFLAVLLGHGTVSVVVAALTVIGSVLVILSAWRLGVDNWFVKLLPVPTGAALVEGSFSDPYGVGTEGPNGEYVLPTILTFTDGLVYWTVLTVALGLVAGWAFRRRDVAR